MQKGRTLNGICIKNGWRKLKGREPVMVLKLNQFPKSEVTRDP